MIAFLVYVGTIVAANVAITYIGLVPVGFGLLAPAGVYAAGVSFTASGGTGSDQCSVRRTAAPIRRRSTALPIW
jgi:hypothetical protein